MRITVFSVILLLINARITHCYASATEYLNAQSDPFPDVFMMQDENASAASSSNVRRSQSQARESRVSYQTIAVIDIQLVLNKALSNQKIQSQSRKLIEQIRSDIKYHENQLKQLEADMMKKHQNAPNDLDSNLSQFNAKLNAAYEIIKNKRSNLEKIQSDSLRKIHIVLMELIEKFAKENGIMVVLPKNQTLFADHKLDITPIMLELLNKRLAQREFSVMQNSK
ncbi:OmpH family outer membrane protein [Rickettsiales endosymbiont of Paramecium tredecaurelia]|uniref:OmpH family outer membrane protein n=1 Tax=Candidatus Sarmatiella mevalonica TaxID=2770581 RepID=UPI0019220D94|nr:OmpH family outer membrane protein [Candidatus Sarmatiella mevalonica]MBL3284994.1 OmpH family outer membrane protein [Candidatus Sarmatiella mevalonica]